MTKRFYQMLPWLIVAAALLIMAVVIVLNPSKHLTPSTIAIDQVLASLPDTATGKAVREQEQALDDYLNNQMRDNETLAKKQVVLAQLYIQLVRETADATYYLRMNQLLDAAEESTSERINILALRSAVAAGLHDFQAAKDYAEQAIELDAGVPLYYGLLADAQIELGDYAGATTSLQTMVDLRPDFAAYSRIAYLRELHGDIPGAIEALNAAIAGGSYFSENLAWAVTEIGHLTFRSDLVAAQRQYERALLYDANYAPALAGLGKVAWAQADTTQAIIYYQQALEVLPLASYTTDLADLYRQTGDSNKAEVYYQLTESAYDQSVASGTNVDLELAYFLLTHDRNVDTGADLALRAYEARPSIYSADVYALALYKQNKFTEAEAVIQVALRLGEADPKIDYHAGLIAQALNDTDEARRYFQVSQAMSPYFSIVETPQLKQQLSQWKPTFTWL